MFPALSLLTTLLLAISTAASPVGVPSSRATLPLAKRIHSGGGAVNIVQNDRARAAALQAQAVSLQRRDYGGPLTDSINTTAASLIAPYVTTVGVGSPPTTYNLMIDMACGNTWVGNNKPYKPTSTSRNISQPMFLLNPQSVQQGWEWVDTLTLSPDLVIPYQSIAVASTFSDAPDTLSGLDGALGLGPVALTTATYINQPMAQIPTVADNLYNQGTIPIEAFSFYFAPPDSDGRVNAEITFGGTDPSKYTGQISYGAFIAATAQPLFWSCNMTVAYGDNTIADGVGMVDTGFNLIYTSPDIYAAYMSATGAVEDKATNMLKLTPSQYSDLQNLNIVVSSQTFALVPNAQIWPRTLNSYIGGSNGAIYSVLSVLVSQNNAAWDLQLILGAVFFERFYVVVDFTHERLGFATTIHSNATDTN